MTLNLATELWIIRFFFYGWALYEVGNLFAIYFMAHKADKDDFITSLMLISCALLLLVLVLMALSLLSHFIPNIESVARNVIVLPIVFLSLSVRGLRTKYKKNGSVK